MYRLLVMDLDDTLAPIGSGINESTISLLRKIQYKRIRLAICSGKPVAYLCGIARQIGFSDVILIGENGASTQFGMDLPPKYHYTLPISQEVQNQLMTIKRELDALFAYQLWFQPNQCSVTPFPRTEEEFEIIMKYAQQQGERLKGIQVLRHKDAIDFLPAGLSKGEGLRALTQHTGILPEEMISIGDGINDLPMFQYTGLSFGIKLDDCPDVNYSVNTIDDALEKILMLLDEKNEEASWREPLAGNKHERVRDVKSYLDTNLTSQIRLDELAQRFDMNKNYLAKAFRDAYGISIINYVNQERIHKGRMLLRYSDYTIAEIARVCGMKDKNYFSRMFRKMEGISPSAYRVCCMKSDKVEESEVVEVDY